MMEALDFSSSRKRRATTDDVVVKRPRNELLEALDSMALRIQDADSFLQHFVTLQRLVATGSPCCADICVLQSISDVYNVLLLPNVPVYQSRWNYAWTRCIFDDIDTFAQWIVSNNRLRFLAARVLHNIYLNHAILFVVTHVKHWTLDFESLIRRAAVLCYCGPWECRKDFVQFATERWTLRTRVWSAVYQFCTDNTLPTTKLDITAYPRTLLQSIWRVELPASDPASSTLSSDVAAMQL